MSVIHELKCDAHYFAEILSGRKTFEVRHMRDRCYQAGDGLFLYSKPHPGFDLSPAQKPLKVLVLGVYTGLPGLAPDHCIMSLRLMPEDAFLDSEGTWKTLAGVNQGGWRNLDEEVGQ